MSAAQEEEHEEHGPSRAGRPGPRRRRRPSRRMWAIVALSSGLVWGFRTTVRWRGAGSWRRRRRSAPRRSSRWQAVVEAALWPPRSPERRRRGRGRRPSRGVGGWLGDRRRPTGLPSGSHGTAYDERRVGEGEERDQAGEPGSEGFAVVEAAVGEAGRDAEGLYSVGEEGEREQGERSPAGPRYRNSAMAEGRAIRKSRRTIRY